MKISIAMATYNGESFIGEQLQSFIDQSRQPDEVIITDDCSTDDTEAIVREFENISPFEIKFYKNNMNLGYCGNFNNALMKSTGDLVLLSDQDDVWFPEKIEHIMRLVECHPNALLIMNNAELTDRELNTVGLTKIGQINSAGLPISSFVMGCCCAIKRDLLDICLPIVSGYKAHDNWLIHFAEGLDGKIIDETVLQYYRRHDSNESKFIANRTTRVTRRDMFFDRLNRIFFNKKNDIRVSLSQVKMFCEGVERSLQRAPHKYQSQLSEMLEKELSQVRLMEERVEIYGKPFHKRLIAIFRLYWGGGYQGLDGCKSALRDLIG